MLNTCCFLACFALDRDAKRQRAELIVVQRGSSGQRMDITFIEVRYATEAAGSQPGARRTPLVVTEIIWLGIGVRGRPTVNVTVTVHSFRDSILVLIRAYYL